MTFKIIQRYKCRGFWSHIFPKNPVEILILVLTFVSVVFGKIKHFNDSWRYIQSSFSFGLFDFNFWFGQRSPGLPLIVRFMGDGFVLSAFHSLFYALSWVFFYRSLCKHRPSRQDHLFNIIFLCVVFSSVFASWNFAVLTESASLSCVLMILSFLLRAIDPVENPPADGSTLLKLTPCLLFFSFLRDMNSLISFFIILPLSVFFLYQGRKILFAGLLILGGGLLSFTLYSISSFPSLGMKQRWVLPTLNNFSQRIMRHGDWEMFSKTHHIPVSDELLELKGKSGVNRIPSYYKTKKLEEFRLWFLTHGSSTYKRFLLRYPKNTLRMLRSHFFDAYQIMDCSTCHEYVGNRNAPITLRTPLWVLFTLIVSWLVKQLIVFRLNKNKKDGFPMQDGGRERLFWFSLLLSCASVLCVCVIILADPVEIPRHSILPLLLAVVSTMGVGLSISS